MSDGAKGGPFTAAAIVAGPKHGSATVAGTHVSFVLETGFRGTAVVKYTLANSFGTSAVHTIKFLMAARPGYSQGSGSDWHPYGASTVNATHGTRPV